MHNSVRDLLLVTATIRKEKLQPSALPHFPVTIAANENEHFVELDVIIRVHAHVYANNTFRGGVNALMALRNHFNEPGNIFRVPKAVNGAKKNLTMVYLDKDSLPALSASLRQYITEAAPIALQHIQNCSGVHQGVRDGLTDYVLWLCRL